MTFRIVKAIRQGSELANDRPDVRKWRCTGDGEGKVDKVSHEDKEHAIRRDEQRPFAFRRQL
jgi:hypothetical protein